MPLQSESVVLCLGDIHYGKKTRSYNTDVFQERMEKLGLKLNNIKSLLKGYSLPELVLCFLGDINDGSGVYPNQPAYQDRPDPRQQAKELSSFLANWITKLKRTWKNIRVEGVCGNHSRCGRYIAEAASWDLITFDLLKEKLAGQVEVGYNDYANGNKDPFVRMIEIRGHRYLLYHAHEIRMYQTCPWYGIFTRLQRWYSTTSLGPFDVSILGHFHTLGSWKINNIRALCTGTMVSDDDWALRTLGMEPATQWWLFGVSNKHPLTWLFNLELT